MDYVLSDEELKSFIVAVYSRYGLDFRNYETKSLKRGMTRLMMKHDLKTSLDLWTKVLREPDFFQNSIDDLMVNLTELFRNPDAWVTIREKILAKYKHKKELKILHAGCSTGEEVYTMAFVLEESNLLHKTKAHAIDLSATALEKAKEGEYSHAVLNNYLRPFLKYFPTKHLKDFFIYGRSSGKVHDKYKRHVKFERFNLAMEDFNEKYDIIFCRNVMIYFDESLKTKVLNKFNNCLNDDGYFVIGYYDTMPDSAKRYFEVYDTKTRVYTKRVMENVGF